MFWNKKEVVEVDELPITLSLRTNCIVEKKGFWHEKVITKKFLAYKTGDTWNGLVGYEEYKKKTDLLEAKLDLILDHLKLEYVPETETKEPAKLVEKTNYLTSESGYFAPSPNRNKALDLMVLETLLKGVAVPKKKGRPKKK